MKINEAFIAQKKRKITELETKKNIIEEKKNKAEIEIEDINTLLVINNEQLISLFEEANLSKSAKNKFVRLICKKALVIFFLIGLGLTVNLTILILLMGYGFYSIPKIVEAFKYVKHYNKSTIDSEIEKMRKCIQVLEEEKEDLAKNICKLDYVLENIDVEKKVMQDILSFISEREKDSLDSELFSEKVDLNRTRINPCM